MASNNGAQSTKHVRVDVSLMLCGALEKIQLSFKKRCASNACKVG